jgi:hypothetical protein
VVKPIYLGSNSRFDMGVVYLWLIILSMIDDVHSLTNFMNLRIKSVQSFRYVHINMVCMCIHMGEYLYMYKYLCLCYLTSWKKIYYVINLSYTQIYTILFLFSNCLASRCIVSLVNQAHISFLLWMMSLASSIRELWASATGWSPRSFIAWLPHMRSFFTLN